MSRNAADVASDFFETLYSRDWEKIRGFFNDESIYYDVPTGPSTAAKGPADIEARLRLGLEGLSGYEHKTGVVVSEGDWVFTEHAETWRWPSGESVTLPFVSVQRIEDGVIVLWRDYWDYKTLMDAAPQSWKDRLQSADLSWLFDAAGIA